MLNPTECYLGHDAPSSAVQRPDGAWAAAWGWGASVAAFLTYGADKWVAVERGRGREDFGRRTPEGALQAFALLGGEPGAMLARRVFRHKTSPDKRGFRARAWLLAAAHYAAVAGLAFLLARRGG